MTRRLPSERRPLPGEIVTAEMLTELELDRAERVQLQIDRELEQLEKPRRRRWWHVQTTFEPQRDGLRLCRWCWNPRRLHFGRHAARKPLRCPVSSGLS